MRRLSSLEKYFLDRSQLNLHSCFYLGICLNELPEKALLCQALRSTIAEHPLLHQNIALDPEDNQPYIKSIDKTICFNDVVEYALWEKYNENSINYIFRTYNFPYFVDKPLWKIIIHEREKKLILLLDHVFFDGMSAVLFWKTFLRGLSSPVTHRGEELYASNSRQELEQECHPYETWPITWNSKLKRLALGLLFRIQPSVVISPGRDQFSFKEYSFADGLFVNDKKEESCQYQIRNDNCQQRLQMPAEKLLDTLALCKKHQVSLTSFLAAVFSIALGNTIQEADYDGSYLRIDVPMNTRKACASILGVQSASIEMGVFVASLELKYDLKCSKQMWEVAEEFQEKLTSQTSTNILETVNDVRLLDVTDTAKFIEEKLKLGRPTGTFEVTNLGFQDFMSEGNSNNDSNNRFIVEDAVFNEPQGISDIFTFSIISTRLGGLSCSVSYPRDIRSKIEPSLVLLKKLFHDGIGDVTDI